MFALTLAASLVLAADESPTAEPAASAVVNDVVAAVDAAAEAIDGSTAALPTDDKSTTETKPVDVPVADDAAKTPIEEKPMVEDPTAGIESKYPVDRDEWLTADPLLIIDNEMNTVVSDMKDGDLFRPHSTTQPRIIARFDRLIEMLERKKSGGGAAGSQPMNPAGASTLAGGPKDAGKLRAADDETGAMEKLSGDQRKKIQQANADGFPPGFDDVLSDYYRRLAETKAAE